MNVPQDSVYIYSSLHIRQVLMGGRGMWTVNITNLAVPAGFNTSKLVLHAVYRVSNKHWFSYNYFVTGDDE
jgi:hypothetical protein